MQNLSCSLTENRREVIGPSTWRWPPGLRMIHSLVHITGRPLMWDDADINLPLPEYYYRYEDEIKFHHKSFIDYLLDPSRSLEYCIDMEEMNTRLSLACIVTMQTFSLQPTPSRVACSTFSLSFLQYTNPSHRMKLLGVMQHSAGPFSSLSQESQDKHYYKH